MRLFSTLLFLSILAACNSSKILDKPIIFDQERKDLTLQYLSQRYGLEQEEPLITPKMVVVHWTAIPTLEKSFQAFYNTKLPNWRPEIVSASAVNVSSHFLVDTDGTIYRLMPENFMARHVIGLNHCAIGIENVGPDDNNELSPAQLEANTWLLRYLKEKYNVSYLIGHYEYTHFTEHELWLEKDDNYRTEKTDPGVPFMMHLREATRDLNWLPVPAKPVAADTTMISPH
ncbi:MAG: N-acetylmuramoyl-L-alanine amidase [Cyclobacteriaceae bacterium]|nr:N-acetylmuramoyl-L-alanine amidase [Cyclobacteriaceae bacterium HetDA_MAG_MS6]